VAEAGIDLETKGARDVQTLYHALQQVPDQRGRRGRRYEAATVLSLLVLAKLAGEQSREGVVAWTHLHQPLLTEALGLTQLPCANTYSYVCAHLDVVVLSQVLGRFLGAQTQPVVEWVAGLVHLALDGKSLCGTGSEGEAPHGLLGVYAVAAGLVQHLLPIAGKGQERAAASAFVAQGCRGYLVTADALHTQRTFCRQIKRQGGEYLLIAKRNQRTLHADIALLFSLEPTPLFPEQQASLTESGHGRIVTRSIRTSCELNDYLRDRWHGVEQVFAVTRRVVRKGKVTEQVVYGLTSLTPEQAPPHVRLALLQAHWQIENRSHWRRDVILGEDGCPVRQPQVAMVLAALNCLVLALVDRLGFPNARSAIRTFAAHPDQALALILHPL
jgi:predicted transposase YbfD/YdcC